MNSERKNLAIISSYNESCGNASYSKALADGFGEYYNVEVIALNTDLLRNEKAKNQNLHIKNICKKICESDYVNIQFEAGLFGTNPKIIFKRFKKIAINSKKMIITMHRYDITEKMPSFVQFIKACLRFKLFNFLKRVNKIRINNQYASLYTKIINLCKERNIPIIMHTPRDKQLIKILYQYENVYDHPLCFFSQEKVREIRNKTTRNDFCKHFNLPTDQVYLGIFGFINEYKGHETAIEALQFLPKNHNLLIFGSQHPHSIRLGEKINPYIESLMQLIIKKNLNLRVKFFGNLNDDQFFMALANCDFNILPYLEVNQGGSGIAALTLEAGKQALFSHNKAFMELLKYAPDAFKTFSIGNYLELANAILSYNSIHYLDKLSEYHKNYNIQTSINLYKNLFEAS